MKTRSVMVGFGGCVGEAEEERVRKERVAVDVRRSERRVRLDLGNEWWRESEGFVRE